MDRREGDESGGLRRDLGTLESYAALIGILIGAGVFRVTADAWRRTGPGVLVAYLVLAVAVLATAIPYAVFASTPLGRAPGGEYSHIARVLRSPLLAFTCAWLKVISYVGALAFLADATAGYLAGLFGWESAGSAQLPLAIATLAVFLVIHLWGVRWFGRLQVWMCLLLAASIVVLVVPGIFAVRGEHLTPLFPSGAAGFASSLPILFFAYAGFESLAQTAGEVSDSTRRLPGVFLRGIAATTLIFFLLSLVTVGSVAPSVMAATQTPMADAAAVFLPPGLAWFVTLGAVMALATSVNATMLVPSRLAIMLARDGHLPGWFGLVHATTGTPVIGLIATFAGAVLLLATGQISLALNIAVFALILLYFVHGVAFLALPSRDPELWASARVRLPPAGHWVVGWVSLVSLGALVVVQVSRDAQVLATTSWAERYDTASLTGLELAVAWGVFGVVIYAARHRGTE